MTLFPARGLKHLGLARYTLKLARFNDSLPRKGTETSPNAVLTTGKKCFNDSLPRKGTETWKIDMILGSVFVSMTLFPARGLKHKLLRNLNVLGSFNDSLPRKGTETKIMRLGFHFSGTSFQWLSSPQGDWNLSSRRTLDNCPRCFNDSLPRKGTETAQLRCYQTQFRCFNDSLPRKGTETRMRLSEMLVTSKVSMTLFPVRGLKQRIVHKRDYRRCVSMTLFPVRGLKLFPGAQDKPLAFRFNDSLPRKGTETFKKDINSCFVNPFQWLSSPDREFNNLQNWFSERGELKHSFRKFWVLFSSRSPQGDWNIPFVIVSKNMAWFQWLSSP
jgi:hypothetical protein